MTVPVGEIAHDGNSCKEYLHGVKLTLVHSSNYTTSTQFLRVFEWLVESDIDGVVWGVSCDLIRVSNTSTGFNVDRPVKWIGP